MVQNAAMLPSKCEKSPILEILQVVALTGFPINMQDSQKKLIIVSDMLHHTEAGRSRIGAILAICPSPVFLRLECLERRVVRWLPRY
jgi:hypothetical protein